MTRKGAHTPITDDEAEEWVRRMIGSEEDLGMTFGSDEWEEFVRSKIEAERGYEPTDAQLRRMGEVRGRIAEQVGYSTEYLRPDQPWLVRFRDTATGKFMSRDAAEWRFLYFTGLL